MAGYYKGWPEAPEAGGEGEELDRVVEVVKVNGRSHTGDGRGVYETSRAAKETAVDHIARTEIDNHADTCCFGQNFAVKYLTRVKCSVSTFSKEQEAMVDVEAATAYTAYDNLEDCCTYILEFNEGLWFGNRMDHSLINPNQVRMTGISLCMALLIDIERLGSILSRNCCLFYWR